MNFGRPKRMSKPSRHRKSSLGNFLSTVFNSDFKNAGSKSSIGNIMEIDEEMQLDEDVCYMSDNPNRPFKLAAAGNYKEVEKILSINPLLATATDEEEKTLLHHAVSQSKTKIMDILIVYRTDVNAKDKNGNTALHLAVLNNQTYTIAYLILNGANPNLSNNDFMAPIHLAVYNKKLDSLKELLKHPEVNKNETTKCGNSAVHIACEIDYQEGLEYLLKCDVNICSPNIYGIYPVHVAIKHCNEKCLEMLVVSKLTCGLTAKQILNFADKEGNVPLHTAVNTGDTKAVQMCLHYGANIDVRQNDNSTPLHYACTKGELDIVKLMIRSRSEVKDSVLKIKDNNGHTPLHKAVMFNYVDLTIYLIEEGSEIEATDDNGWTPLLLAASRLNMCTFRTLIKYGANIFARDISKRNIIHLLSQNIINDKIDILNGMEKMIQQSLITIINEKDNMGCTPLHYSTRRGLLRLTGILIKMGGLCMTQNNDKDTPLHFAARYGREHTCRKLLNTIDGLKAMNSTDSFGRLPIHAAAENGYTKIIQLLLDKGCIFHRCYHGNTPLHFAAMNGHIEACQYLIEINPSLLDNQDHEGKTALHIAAINDRSNVVGLLLTHGAAILNDKQGFNFLTHTLKLKNFSTAKEVVTNSRWEEIMHIVDEVGTCSVIGMIKDMPNIFTLALDKSISTEGSRGQKDFKIIYNFALLQRTVATKEDLRSDPFYVVKTMVDLKRVDLLMHPLCTAYLKMKWERFGRWVQYMIMLMYILFLCALSFSTYTITFSSLKENERRENFTGECEKFDTFYGHKKEKQIIIIMAIFLLCYSSVNLMKQFIQIIMKTYVYFLEFQNYISLILHISTVILSIFLLQMKVNDVTIQVAAIAIFIGWFNLLLLLFHFEKIGIFVIMFVQILRTVILVLVIFSILFIGFAFSFVILFRAPTHEDIEPNDLSLFGQCFYSIPISSLEPAIKAWQTLPLGLLKSVVMMMGEIEFLNTYVTPFHDDSAFTLKYPGLTFAFLVMFIIFMSLLLMNLLIGLAVGDIEAVQKNANLQRISLQVSWLSEFESKLPLKIRNWAFKEIWEVFPYRCPLENICACDAQVIYKKSENEESKDLTNMFDTLSIHEKQLYNLLVDSRQQTELLKLILQKMEMDPEAEINDDTAPEITRFSRNWKNVIASKNIIFKMSKSSKTGNKS